MGEVAKLNNGKDYKHLGDGNIPVYGTGGYMLSVNQALSYKDDAIGIGRKGTIDKPYILKAPFWTVDTLFYSIPNDKTELNFLFATFQKVDWKAADESTGVPSLSKSTIENIITFFPSLPEQARIGAFFCHLDRLITLHQCNCNMATRPCEWSSGLRAIAWEQRKLGDLAGFLPNNTFSRAELSENGRIQNIHYGDVLIKFGEVLDVANEQLPFVAKTKKINKISELKLENGDIVFADAAEDKTVGKCTELFNIIDKIVISGLHTIPCRPQIAFATAYLGYFFNSPCYRTQLLPLMQGIKVLSLSKTALLQTDIFYPKDQSEQARIGTFFRHLDRLITLHQRKHILLT